MSSGVKALSFHNWFTVSAGKRLSSLRRFLSSSSTSNQQHPNTTASLHRSSSDASQAATSHGCIIIREGQAQILMDPSNQVFYNQTQVKNRDISISLLRKFISKRKQEAELLEENNEVKNALKSGGVESINCTEDSTRMVLKPIRVLEALSASGLRALRYACEVEEIGEVVALDNDKVSVEACKRNIKFNGPKACEKVESHLADARVYMLTHPKEFDVVDLDPYGSPSMFLDSAVQSVVDGGILMCSATDMAVLCGASSEVCYSKYGSYPLREEYRHEMALRILLASIESHANRYKRYIVPVLSVKMDFYIRVYVRIYISAAAMKNTPLKLSHVYQCTGCDSFHLQPIGRTVLKDKSTRYLPGFAPTVPQECNDCGKKFNMGGPIWSAPIHDHEWELLDVPLFLNLHSLCATLKCTPPSTAMFRSAIINAGFRISGTHINPPGLKSDAPIDVIWDILRCWVKKHRVKAQSATQAGNRICTKEPVHQANFAQAATSTSNAQKKKVVRFLPNPKRHWGPKLRAGRNITSKHISLLGAEAVNEYPHHEESED